MNVKPIRNPADHAAALARIEELWDAEPDTNDGDTLEVLATLVDAYERVSTPILPPDPIAAIRFRLDQQGETRKALEVILGTRARVSEVLSGQRALSLNMIRALHDQLQIPLEVLIGTSSKVPTKARKKAVKKKAKERRSHA